MDHFLVDVSLGGGSTEKETRSSFFEKHPLYALSCRFKSEEIYDSGCPFRPLVGSHSSSASVLPQLGKARDHVRGSEMGTIKGVKRERM